LSQDIEALAKGGRTNVMGFFIRLIARIPFLIVAGQWYGAVAMGRLAIAIAVVEFAAQITTLGLKRGLALHLSGDGKENGAWDAILVVIAATLIPTIFLIAFPQILFPNSPINRLDNLLPLIIPMIALADIMLAALAFRMDVVATVRARAIVEPWTISIVAVALYGILPRDGLLIAYAVSMAAALIAALIPFLLSYGPPRNWTPRGSQLFALARHNAPLAAADAIEWGSRRVDILILALFVSPATVGIYWVAQQVASLPQKLKSSFEPVLGPVIVKKLEEGDKTAVARQISQVGFWIIAAQAGVALSLGIPGEGVMGLIGPGRDYVGGTGALAFLLLAEVAASVAVVSEAALIYVARHRNFMISLAMIAVQIVLTFALIIAIRAAGYSQLYQAAAPAIALTLSLSLSSFIKSRLAAKLLGAPVSVLRWPLVTALAAATIVGQIMIRLPEWIELAFGIFAILGTYGAVIWRFGFTDDDRMLFRKNK
jgi:O-antigen/teichoic acid export membrane protein